MSLKDKRKIRFDGDEFETKFFDYKEEDVKEFIERIEMHMLVTPSPMEKGEFILWLVRKIREEAGLVREDFGKPLTKEQHKNFNKALKESLKK